MLKTYNDGKGLDSSRRAFLKLAATGFLAGLVAPFLPRLAAAQTAAAKSGKKILVVYYSRTGNTREVADRIHQFVGGDLVAMETVNPYPGDYRETTRQAKRELESGYRPPIKTKIPDLASYDMVFLGSPNWWGTIAMPVMTFLSENDLSGKTIAPFMTHGGSALGRSRADIEGLCPKATVLDGLAIPGTSVKTSQQDVAAWLRSMGMPV
ncbi:flavodoxin [Solidesulfovibrio sp.]|uniref:flavodoxin n=1 Tax=Solidesulfovibrio sp. TaxID=2910990 RepID=UPI00261A64CD|nr:flavodoxin [Solidesulfovibrio sp.]